MPYDPDSRLYDPRLGGGSLLDLGIYPVALAWLVYQRLPGKLAVDMHLADTGVDDEILARCDFGSQQALLACSFKQKLANTAIIRGDKGHIEIPDFWRATECRLYQGDDCIESFVDDRKGSGFEFQIGHVNDCIRNGYNQSDQVPFEVSFRFQEFMELIRIEAG
jgi:predicted dehydrogenase